MKNLYCVLNQSRFCVLVFLVVTNALWAQPPSCTANAGKVLPLQSDFCVADSLRFFVEGNNTGLITQFVLTDDQGMVIRIENESGVFPPLSVGTYRVFAFNFDPVNPPNNPPGVGKNISTVQNPINNCFDISTAFSISVSTDPGPQAACISDTVMLYLDQDGGMDLAPTDLDLGSQALSCGTLDSLSLTRSVFTCADIGVVRVGLVAHHPVMGTDTCYTYLHIRDTLPPEAHCAEPVYVYLNDNGNGNLLPPKADLGSIDNCGLATLEVLDGAVDCSDRGPGASARLVATDEAGLTDTCTVQMLVRDTLPPQIQCITGITLSLDATGTATLSENELFQLISDPCNDLLSPMLSQKNFTCADVGENTVHLQVVDEQNNSTQCLIPVTVKDTIAPNARCRETVDVFLDQNGRQALSMELLDAGSADGCSSDLLLSLDLTQVDCQMQESFFVELLVEDESGNSDRCRSLIHLRDTVAPAANCQTATVYLDARGEATLIPEMLDGGSLDACGAITFSASQTLFSCDDLGSVGVVLSVKDDANNTRTCTAEVVVMDTLAPELTCTPTTIFLDGLGSARLTASDIDGGSSDNCGLNALSVNRAVWGCGNLGDNNITLTAVDRSGSRSQCVTTVTIRDTVAPVALCRSSQEIYLDSRGLAALHPNDVDAGSQDNCGSLANTVLSQYEWNCSQVGPQSVILSVADPSGNVDQCTARVEVVDTVAPTAVCEEVMLYLDNRGLALLDPTRVGIFSSDNCGNDVELELDKMRFTCGDLGEQIVELTVTDAQGHQADCRAQVTVLDTLAPKALCRDLTIYLDDSGQATLSPGEMDAGSVDNCGIPVNRYVSQSVFTCADLGVYEVLLTVEDAAGNTGTCSSVIEVSDTIRPRVACRPFTLELGINGQGTLTSDLINNQSSDNCGSDLVYTLSRAEFTCADLGLNQVVLTGTDPAGLSSQCTASVRVIDSVKPTGQTRNIDVFLNDDGTVRVDPLAVDNGSTDNCTIINYSLDKSVFSCNDLGPNLVNLTLTDSDSNTTTKAAVVTVIDTLAPELICPSHVVFSSSQDGESDCQYVINDNQLDPTRVFDNCGFINLTHNLASAPSDTSLLGSYLPLGTTDITWTVSDGDGLQSNCVIRVTVEDNDPPLANCRDSLLIQLSNVGSLTLDFSKLDAGSKDNCGITEATLSKTEFDCSDIGFHTVESVLKDEAGNQSSCTTVIGVISSGACQMPILRNDAGPDISDPCTCRGDGSFDEQVVIGPANPGLQWTVQATDLLHPVTLQPYAAGTPFQEIDQGNGQSLYVLPGVHLDGKGYTLTAESPFYTDDLSIQNTCFYPDPEILGLARPICLYTDPITLEGTGGTGVGGIGTFYVNGQVRTTFDPMEWGTGIHLLEYTFDAGDPSDVFLPSNVACTETVSRTVTVLETPENFACNDLVSITANTGCEVFIRPEMVLSGDYLCYDDYEVFISYEGRAVPNPVPAAYIGLRLRTLIRHIPSGRLCFGNIELIDRQGPKIDSCAADIRNRFVCTDVGRILNNEETIDPSSPWYTGRPTVEDNCSGTVLTFQDLLVDEGACDGDNETAYIRRRFFAEDQFGNVSTCDQLLYFERPRDLYFPSDTLIRIDCQVEPLPVTPQGNLAPAASGAPFYRNGFGEFIPIGNNGDNCGFAAIYSDQRINICGGQYTLLREWRIFDFCSNTTVQEKTQIIEVGDFDAPVVHCRRVDFNQDGLPDPIPVFSTDPDACTASLQIPLPNVEDCSSVTIETRIFSWVPEEIFGFPTGDTLFQELDEVSIQNGMAAQVPVGDHFFIFRVRDICGNTTMDTCAFQVKDLVSPVVFCDDDITVTLDNSGEAMIFPGDIDEGSRDNCDGQNLDLSIRKLVTADCGEAGYTHWSQMVNLTCCDAGRLVTAELRVADNQGNTNNCVSRIKVEDKNKPVCLPPADVSIDCNRLPLGFDPFDPLDLQQEFGVPSVQDNCGGNWEELDPLVDLDDCGFGLIIRQFRARDVAGNPSAGICQQTIELGEVHHYRVRFPEDVATHCGEPEVPGIQYDELACDLLAVSVQNDTFLATLEGCFKVHRTYQVINWCEYDGLSTPVTLPRNADCDESPGDEALWLQVEPDGNVYLDRDNDFANATPQAGEKGANCDGLTNPEGYWISTEQLPAFRSRGFWRYTQHITVYDQTEPVVQINPSEPFCTDSKTSCSGAVAVPFTILETCTSPQDVGWVVQWDQGNDNFPDSTLSASAVTGTYPDFTIAGRYPLGQHAFLLTVTDGCGNTTQKRMVFEVVDCQAPAPICLSGVVVELEALEGDEDVDGDGQLDLAAALVNARDLLGSEVADCSGQVRYSVNRRGQSADSTRVAELFTCADEGTVVLELHAWDLAGNHSFCEVAVEVQNNGDVCTLIPEGAIMGQVKNEKGMEVPNVLISLSGSSSKSARTDLNGGYRFEELEEGGDYSLIPLFDESPGNGVTTYDLILIRRHILGYSPLSSPYKLIAADVNNSGTITALDMVQLQRMILGYSAEFENNNSWRFVDAEYTFQNPRNPWASGFPEVVNINNLNGQITAANFVAIKVGDVNLTSRVVGATSDPVRSNQQDWTITIPNKIAGIGETVRLPFFLPKGKTIEGYQFTLQYDPDQLELVSVIPGLATSDQFGYFPTLGMLTTHWYRQEEDDDHQPLFTLVVRGKNPGVSIADHIELNGRITAAEAYGPGGELMRPVLSFEDPLVGSDPIVLLGNHPNPFRTETRIHLLTPNSWKGQLVFFNAQGTPLREIPLDLPKGEHWIRLERGDFPSGIIYYQIRGKDFRATRKLVVLK